MSKTLHPMVENTARKSYEELYKKLKENDFPMSSRGFRDWMTGWGGGQSDRRADGADGSADFRTPAPAPPRNESKEREVSLRILPRSFTFLQFRSGDRPQESRPTR